MNLKMVCGMCECILNVSNALLMSSASEFMRAAGLFCLKHITMVLLTLCVVL